MTTVGSGKYTYTLIQDWAKLPPGHSFGSVSAVATDSQDRVYAFQRAEPPVVVSIGMGISWGHGATGLSSTPTVSILKTTSSI